jgi:hypothetical protein
MIDGQPTPQSEQYVRTVSTAMAASPLALAPPTRDQQVEQDQGLPVAYGGQQGAVEEAKPVILATDLSEPPR